MHGYFNLGLKVNIPAFIYGKSNKNICTWIHNGEECKSLARITGRKFNNDNRMFILDLFLQHPTRHLDEVRCRDSNDY